MHDLSEERTYTPEQVDAAVAALSDPERLRHAQDVITHAAPVLQRILNAALEEGGYLNASGAQIAEAAQLEDAEERVRTVRSMVAEETRLGMLVGAAIGFELARELAREPEPPQED